MLRNRDRISFRAALLAGVSGLALMGVVTLPIGAAKAQNVLVNNGPPPAGTATSNVTVPGNNLTVPGSVSGTYGSFTNLFGTNLLGGINANENSITNVGSVTGALGSGLEIQGGTGQISGRNINATGGVSATYGTFTTLNGTTLGGGINAAGNNIEGVGRVTVGSAITLNGQLGGITGSGLTVTGDVRAEVLPSAVAAFPMPPVNASSTCNRWHRSGRKT